MASLGVDYGTGSWKIALLVEVGHAFRAIVADGIAGGRNASLVGHLGLRDVRDRALDWIYR